MGPLISRRDFALATTVGALGQGQGAPMVGEIIGASASIGHLLRDGIPQDLADAGSEQVDVLVVGAGVAGLAAAWRLTTLGVDAQVVELESFLGGTSTYQDSGPVAHPFGAHYLPVPNRGARPALRLLAEIGVLEGFDIDGAPRIDPKALCHAPEERVFYQGRWFAGLIPKEATTQVEEAELERFSALAERYAQARGRDGKKAFSIPIADSSQDPEFRSLDKISMATFLAREGFATPMLRWYVEYATLDDHGSELSDVSAWAALHYFAARDYRHHAMGGSHYLVWPEGNGFLVRAMRERTHAKINVGRLVYAIRQEREGFEAQMIDIPTRARTTIRCRGLVLAVPAFIANRILGAERGLPVRVSSPWLVANLHVESFADPNQPWDSVIYGGRGLGYVDASHQLLVPQRDTVLTYFRAFGSPEIRASRSALLQATWADLANDVFSDLSPAHPDLIHHCKRIDLARWGHAMPRPQPGFLDVTIPSRIGTALAYGHADVSGIALFEESQRAGVMAAEQVAADLGVRLGETWC